MGLKTVIIQSVGSATPSVGKTLSDLLEVDPQIIARLLYCTPSVLAKEIEESLARKIETILAEAGIEVRIQEKDDPLPPPPQLYELAVHVDDIRKFPEVNKALSEFLGCTEQEALKLMLTDPSIVLGGVSLSTAEALKNKINAEVLASNPQTDLYTLKIIGEDQSLLKEITQVLQKTSIKTKPNQKVFENIDHKTSQVIWSRFQQTGNIKLMNQSFQRYDILLHEFDVENEEQKNCLLHGVGMPENIIYILSDNMPVVLDESVDNMMRIEKMKTYAEAGLTCSYHPLLFQDYNIMIHEIESPEKTKEVIKLFFPEEKNRTISAKWVSPHKTNHLLSRYIVHLLEKAGCVAEILKTE